MYCCFTLQRRTVDTASALQQLSLGDEKRDYVGISCRRQAHRAFFFKNDPNAYSS